MKTVNDIGGPTAVARIVGLSVPTVHGWKRVPEKHCPDIELAKHGEVTVEELRPDIRWVRVKDRSWPNPKGRPVVDYAKPKQEA